MDEWLQEKVDRLSSEWKSKSDSKRIPVIVQMKSSAEDLTEFVEATSRAIRSRRSMIRPLSLLPPRRSSLKTTKTGRLTSASRRELAKTPQATEYTFLASSLLKTFAKAFLESAGLGALKPLLDSELVQSAVAAGGTKSSGGKKSAKPTPVHFWSSGSAVLDLTRDELSKLANEVEGIEDIHANHTLHVPPVLKRTTRPRAFATTRATRGASTRRVPWRPGVPSTPPERA